MGAVGTAAARRPVTYGEVFSCREFRLLWAGQLLSRVGDQLAAVALAVLVLRETGSTLLSAATYAVAFLPWVLGGPLLAGLADRLPRRSVMIGCDLARAALVAVMAVPSVPPAALLLLLFAVSLLDSPFTAARSALLPEVLPGDRYVVGSSVATVTGEVAQVAGFVLGGALVTVVGTRPALLLDALTYVGSALLLARLRHRPAAAGSGPVGRRGAGVLADLRTTSRMLAADPWLRHLTLLAWLCTFYVVPEALAVTYAAASGASPLAAGLLLAANPAGTVLGSVWVSRSVRPDRRLRLMGPLALLSCLPLVACAASPPWWVAGLLWLLSGVGSAYNLPANAAFVTAVPSDRRGQAFGLVTTGMATGQGLALLAAGAAAEVVPAGVVIAVSGAVGTLAAGALAVRLREEAPT